MYLPIYPPKFLSSVHWQVEHFVPAGGMSDLAVAMEVRDCQEGRCSYVHDSALCA
jgi:hypothetical protein